MSSLVDNINENEITAEVIFKKVKVSNEIAKEIKQITELIELKEADQNKSIVFLREIRELLRFRSQSLEKFKKVLFVNDSFFNLQMSSI